QLLEDPPRRCQLDHFGDPLFTDAVTLGALHPDDHFPFAFLQNAAIVTSLCPNAGLGACVATHPQGRRPAEDCLGAADGRRAGRLAKSPVISGEAATAE